MDIWDEGWGVLQRAVIRRQERKQATDVKYIGVDEKAFRKGHSYLTVVCDLGRSTVEYVAEGRTIESLGSYYASLTPPQREGIERWTCGSRTCRRRWRGCRWQAKRSSLTDSTS